MRTFVLFFLALSGTARLAFVAISLLLVYCVSR